MSGNSRKLLQDKNKSDHGAQSFLERNFYALKKQDATATSVADKKKLNKGTSGK